MKSVQKNFSINRSLAAKALGISERTLDRYLKAGRLSYRRSGNKIWLSEQELSKLKSVKNWQEWHIKEEGRGYESGEVDNQVDNVDSRVDSIDREAKKNTNSKPRHHKGLISSYLDREVDNQVDNVDREVDNQVDNVDREVDNVDNQVDNVDRGVYIGSLTSDKAQRVSTSQSIESGLVESIYKLLYQEAKVELKDRQQQLEGANYRVGQLEAQIKNMVPLPEYRQEQKKLLLLEQEFTAEKEHLTLELQTQAEHVRREKFNRRILAGILFLMLILQPIFWLLWRFSQG